MSLACPVATEPVLDEMLIPSESPLRRIPAGLDHRQRLFVDGLRCSIEMADVAFTRLCHMAIRVGADLAAERDPSDKELVGPSMMLDAWSVVDSVHRIRALLQGFPRMRNFPWKELFLRHTADVVELRNCVQHLVGEYGADAGRNEMPWGQLSWISGPHLDGTVCITMVVVGSLAFEITPPVLKPKELATPIDQIVIAAFDRSLSLSDVMHRVSNMTRDLEQAWAQTSKNVGDTLAADALLSVQLRRRPVD